MEMLFVNWKYKKLTEIRENITTKSISLLLSLKYYYL